MDLLRRIIRIICALGIITSIFAYVMTNLYWYSSLIFVLSAVAFVISMLGYIEVSRLIIKPRMKGEKRIAEIELRLSRIQDRIEHFGLILSKKLDELKRVEHEH